MPSRHRLIALAASLAIALAQTPAPQSGPPEGAVPNTVIRIDVNLVQVDAVVTDSRGRRVTDLPASAFEVLQDGKPQTGVLRRSTLAPICYASRIEAICRRSAGMRFCTTSQTSS